VVLWQPSTPDASPTGSGSPVMAYRWGSMAAINARCLTNGFRFTCDGLVVLWQPSTPDASPTGSGSPVMAYRWGSMARSLTPNIPRSYLGYLGPNSRYLFAKVLLQKHF